MKSPSWFVRNVPIQNGIYPIKTFIKRTSDKSLLNIETSSLVEDFFQTCQPTVNRKLKSRLIRFFSSLLL